MKDLSKFKEHSPTAFADVLKREQVMDIGIRPLWEPIPRIAGPGDNPMIHAAIYRAQAGSVIVVESCGLAGSALSPY